MCLKSWGGRKLYVHKIIWNALIQYICVHKDIALQNALGYNCSVLLSPVTFSGCEVEIDNSPAADPKKIFQQENFFWQAKI